MFQYVNGFSLSSNPGAHEFMLTCLQTFPETQMDGNVDAKQERVAQLAMNDATLIALCKLLGEAARQMRDKE